MGAKTRCYTLNYYPSMGKLLELVITICDDEDNIIDRRFWEVKEIENDEN